MSGVALRDLPSTERLAAHALLAEWHDHPAVLARACREALAAERAARVTGAAAHGADTLAAAAAAWLRRHLHPGPHRVINATGTILHTNLGRAPLSQAARDAVLVAAGYSDLEYDLDTGRRGSRQDHVAPLLCALTSAEDAAVVTNNAAGVLLTLRALCRGRDVLVSRGEAVEIGGGFRVPEVMRESGARLVDVGTTNRTRASDYAQAVTARTAAIMRVHPSNFAMTGYVERPSTAEVAAVAHEHGLLVIEDVGSGAFGEVAAPNGDLAAEPALAAVVAAGADVVLASGDKLCGGPQAGLIVGRAELVARIRRHPLMRALRPDKLVVAALAATLAAHLRGDAETTVPVAAMLARPLEVVEGEAAAWAWQLRADGVPADLEAARSEAGGGSLPGTGLPTVCVTLPGPTGRLVAALRAGEPPVVARAATGRVWLDPRTVAAAEGGDLLHAVRVAWEAVHGGRPGRRP